MAPDFTGEEKQLALGLCNHVLLLDFEAVPLFVGVLCPFHRGLIDNGLYDVCVVVTVFRNS